MPSVSRPPIAGPRLCPNRLQSRPGRRGRHMIRNNPKTMNPKNAPTAIAITMSKTGFHDSLFLSQHPISLSSLLNPRPPREEARRGTGDALPLLLPRPPGRSTPGNRSRSIARHKPLKPGTAGISLKAYISRLRPACTCHRRESASRRPGRPCLPCSPSPQRIACPSIGHRP